MLHLGINKVSSESYHAEREYLSSSVLKTIYKDLAEYHDQYILGNKKEFSASSQAAMLEGSLCHGLILEPHLVDQEFAFFPEWRKQGAQYEAFCAENAGKHVVSVPQRERVDGLVRAFNKHKLAVDLHTGGEPELSICAELEGVKVKVRFDYINVEKGYGADLKTTAYAGDVESFRMTVNQLSYQLSAALYCAVAELHYGKPFEFYWVVLSKKDNSCNVYKMSQRTRAEGMRMVNTALTKYKLAKASGIWYEVAAPAAETALNEILEV